VAGEYILIVDDEPAIQATLRGVLEDEGYRVSAVGAAAEAGEQLEARVQAELVVVRDPGAHRAPARGVDALAPRLAGAQVRADGRQEGAEGLALLRGGDAHVLARLHHHRLVQRRAPQRLV